MDLREIGSEVVNLINLVQDKDNWRCFVNTVMNLGGVPLEAGNILIR
jgi:hypothetical protein